MSHFNNIGYHIYKSIGCDFDKMLDELLLEIDEVAKVLRIVCFCDINENDDYLLKLDILRQKVRRIFHNECPVVTLVAQKPLDSGLVLEVHSYKADYTDIVEYKMYENFPYVVVRNKYGKFLFAGGLQSSLEKNIYSQSNDVFDVLSSIFKAEKFPIDSIVRQWNYIERITELDNKGNQHYQMFNNSRSEYYSSGTWINGYPSATGIGTLAGGVVIDVDAVVIEDSCFSVEPIDNKLQIAAHAYSETVLENVETGLTTPKFERAKMLSGDGGSLIYVSGTAAIRGEESICEDVERQLEVTLENISLLTRNTPVILFRVYLKNDDDYSKVYGNMHDYDGIYISYLRADVCRNELLIEIEGIALV